MKQGSSQKVTIAEFVSKSSVLYGIRMFITLFTRATFAAIEPDDSNPYPRAYISHVHLGISNCHWFLDYPLKFSTNFSLLQYALNVINLIQFALVVPIWYTFEEESWNKVEIKITQWDFMFSWRRVCRWQPPLSGPWWRKQQAPLKRRSTSSRLHGAISQKVVLLRTMMMEAISTSETSVYFYETTRRSISESCLTQDHDDRGNKHLWNVGLLLRDYTAQYLRK
jgi:hypothetical protein